MIVSKDVNPERDVYYLGARIIDLLSHGMTENVDFFDLYTQLNSIEDVSMNLYTLTLDWLYLIGVIDNSQNGGLQKCF